MNKFWEKMLDKKIVSYNISYKKVNCCMSLSPPGMELGPPKVGHWFKLFDF